MKFSILIIILFLLNSDELFCQGSESNKLVSEFQWTIFVTFEGSYKFTRFSNELGEFYFKSGFVDTLSYKYSSYEYLSFDLETNNYFSEKRAYIFIDRIDTVYGFDVIRDTINYINVNSLILGENCDNKIFYVTYSYIIQKIDIDFNNKYLALLYQKEHLNHSNRYYLILMKYYEDNKEYKLKYCEIIVKNSEVIIENSFIDRPERFKKRDVKKLNKILRTIDELDEKYCLDPGNPWLLYYKGNSHYVSLYCIRENRRKHRYLRSFNRIFNYL